MTFAETPDSKEIKIRKLNGWLRASVWAILFLVAVGTIAGLLYWRRTARIDENQKEARLTAVDLIVKAIKISDSLALERHNELVDLILEKHGGNPHWRPAGLDTEELKEQLEQKPKEEK